MGVMQGEDLRRMRECGRIVRKALDEMAGFIAAGVSTREIETVGRRVLDAEGATPSFLGYNGYPAAVCVSINQEVVHGIPSTDRFVRNGDLVSIDIGAFKDGFHADAADTVAVGPVSAEAALLVETVYQARTRGIEAAKAGNHLGDIGAAVQELVESRGFSVVRDLVGHGIGRKLHEPPQVPNYGRSGKGMKLTRGLALAVEPMINVGGYGVLTLRDHWTIVTEDGSLSAHAEHTLVVEDGSPLILTA